MMEIGNGESAQRIWDGWKNSDAISGLMAQGLNLEQAYAKVQQIAATKTQGAEGQSVEDQVKKGVEEGIAAIEVARRARRAGAG